MIQRKFIPGSQWLYFKIYTGQKSADEILTNHILPLLTELKEKNQIKQYFFLRYNDPEFHIRLRLLLTDQDAYSAIFQSFNRCISPCIDNYMVSKVMCDTYVREIERYGKNTMEIAEEIFWIDSRAILQIIRKINDKPSIVLQDDLRWKTALILSDDILNAMGMNVDEKIDLLSFLSTGFKKEFGFVEKKYTKKLNDKYRLLRDEIDKTLEQSEDVAGLLNDELNERKNRMKEQCEIIRSLSGSDQTTISRDDLASSLIHMTLNRLFRSRNRAFEMVLYEFLFRHYKSAAARKKHIKQQRQYKIL